MFSEKEKTKEGGFIEWSKKVERVIDLCLTINELQGKAEISFELNGHTKSFEVRAFPEGWGQMSCLVSHNQWFLATYGNISMLDKMICYLEDLLKEQRG